MPPDCAKRAGRMGDAAQSPARQAQREPGRAAPVTTVLARAVAQGKGGQARERRARRAASATRRLAAHTHHGNKESAPASRPPPSSKPTVSPAFVAGGALRRRAEEAQHIVEFVDHTTLGGSEEDVTGELSAADQHPADTSDMTFQRELDLTVRNIAEQRMAEVEEALARQREVPTASARSAGRRSIPSGYARGLNPRCASSARDSESTRRTWPNPRSSDEGSGGGLSAPDPSCVWWAAAHWSLGHEESSMMGRGYAARRPAA